MAGQHSNPAFPRPPCWPSGYGVRLKSGRPGFDSPFLQGDFSGSSHTTDLKIGTLVAALPGVMGSALGLVGPVSVHTWWGREVYFATSISVWHHVQLSEQIGPWGTLACCGYVRQPTTTTIRWSHTSDLGINTPVATLPGTRHWRVCARSGQPSVSILWLGQVASLICNFCLSVATRTVVWAGPSPRHAVHVAGTSSNQETVK